MRRPIRLTLFAVLLGWLSCGALLLAIASPILAWATLPWRLYMFAGLLVGLSGVVACVGIWKRATWTYPALLAWGSLAAGAAALPALTVPGAARWPAALAIVLVGFVGWLIARAVRATLMRVGHAGEPLVG